LFLNFIPTFNIYCIHLSFPIFPTVYPCFAFNKSTDTSKFPFRAQDTSPRDDTPRITSETDEVSQLPYPLSGLTEARNEPMLSNVGGIALIAFFPMSVKAVAVSE
jgi:hypothetical protein